MVDRIGTKKAELEKLNMKLFRKNSIITLVFAILFMLTAGSASCNESELKVAYTEWFPYTFLENGKEAGFEIDIFKAVITKMGLTASFQQFPWKRCMLVLRSGEADVLISLLKNADREKYTYYPLEPISISKTVFFATTYSDIEYKGFYDELKAFSIGVIDGFSYGNTFDQATYLKKEPALNPMILLKKLLGGRNDIAAGNQTVIEGYAVKMDVLDRIRFLNPAIHNQNLYAGFSKAKNLKNITDAFSTALSEYKKSEEYRRILSKYGVTSSQFVQTLPAN